MNPPYSIWPMIGVLAIETTAIVILAALLQWPARFASARRIIWQAALLGLMGVAAFEFTGLGRGLAGWSAARLTEMWVFASTKPPIALSRLPDGERVPAAGSLRPPPASMGNPALLAGVESPLRSPVSAPVVLPEPRTSPAQAASPSFVSHPISNTSWNRWPGVIWIIGALVLLARIAAGRFLCLIFSRRRNPVHDPAIHDLMLSLAQRLGIQGRIRLIESPRLAGPISFGWLRPTIALPVGFSAHFGSARVEAVLAHELAHLAGRDPLWRLLADLLTAVLWWQPLAWWARRQLLAASESAADDASLVVANGPMVLAECLLDLGTKLAKSPACGWLGIQGDDFQSGLGRRIERLTHLQGEVWQSPRRRRSMLIKFTGCAAMIAVAILCTAWAGTQAPTQGEKMNTLQQCWKRSLPAVAFIAMLGAGQNAPGADAEKPPASRPESAVADQPAAASAETPASPQGSWLMDPRMRERYGRFMGPSAGIIGVQPGSGDLSAVEAKLDQILFKEVPAFDGLPLTEVLKFVEEKTRDLDPAKQGLNFIISNASNAPGAAIPATIDPTTGLPIAEPADLAGITIRFNSSLRNLRLRDLLDAITKVANRPVQYQVVEYGVLFCPGHSADAKSKTASAQTADPAIAARYGGMNPAMAARYGLRSVPSAQGIEAIQNKLTQITFSQLPEWDSVPLPAVLAALAEQSLKQDPDKRGINLLIGSAPSAPAGMVSRAVSTEKPEAAEVGLKRLQAWRDAQEAKVRVLKDKLDKLRIDLQISEYVADEGGPTPTFDFETFRKIDSERIAAMTAYSRLAVLTERLGKMGRQELLRALPIACPGDQVLSDLLQKRNAAEQELVQLVQSRGEDHPDVKRTMALLKKIDEQLDQTVASITQGLNVQASTYKAQQDQLEKEMSQAKNADVEKANKFSPYFLNKRELLVQQKLLDQLETRVVQERIETTLRGPEQKSPAGQAAELPVEPLDMNAVTVTCKLPLRNMRLMDVLDAITKLASAPIEYTVEEYGVIFTPRTQREVAAK